jgi:hypothetical protein
MANQIIFTKLGAQADSILDAFEQRAGWSGHDDGKRRVFQVDSPDEHQLKVVETLDAVDEHWADHVGLESPA